MFVMHCRDNTTLLLSPVVSSILSCGADQPQCDTRHLNLTVPVIVSLIHPEAKVRMTLHIQ